MATKQSPRIENGTIKWYEGDAFYLYFTIDDVNSDPVVPIKLEENDKIVVIFRQQCREMRRFEILESKSGLFPVHVDERTTKLFREGQYFYDIELHRNNSDTIQTIVQCGKIEVEGCRQCQS